MIHEENLSCLIVFSRSQIELWEHWEEMTCKFMTDSFSTSNQRQRLQKDQSIGKFGEDINSFNLIFNSFLT